MAEDSYGMGIPLPADSTKVHQFPGVTRNAMERVAELLAGGITEANQDAIEAGVAAAVPPAIDAEIEAAGLLGGASTTGAELAFSITDEAGRRSWLEAGTDGKPTEHAAALMTPAVAPGVAATLTTLPTTTDNPDIMFAVTDEAGRRSWLEADADGKPTEHAAALLGPALKLPALTVTSMIEVAGTTPDRMLYRVDTNTGARVKLTTTGDNHSPTYLPDGRVAYMDGGTPRIINKDNTTQRMTSAADFAAWGDSITELTATDSYTAVLSVMLGVAGYNGGKSSQNPSQIAMRQGGITPSFIVAGGSVPASGAVALSSPLPDRGDWFGAGGTVTWITPGTLAGVPGTLSQSKSTDNPPLAWSFTRTTAGDAVAVPERATFVANEGQPYRDRTQIFFTGRNAGTVERVTEAAKAMRAFLTPAAPRYVVVSVTTRTDEYAGSAAHNNILAINAALQAAHPENYVDVRRFLIDEGMAYLGLTPTQADLDAIAQDTVPPTLMTDGIHPNIDGRKCVARALFLFFQLKGWAN